MPKDDNEPITEYRKKIRQVARSILPNETEAPIIITANVRAWRHFIEMRANQHAEVEIRRLAMEIYYNLVAEVPLLMADYEPILLPDGTQAVYTETRKV
jgi:thymidylate synthase (FAD)